MVPKKGLTPFILLVSLHFPMKLEQLSAISPVDGRYRRHSEALSPYLSEFGLIRYRVLVEIEYFIALSRLKLKGFPPLGNPAANKLREIYQKFAPSDAQRIKETEKTTNHDVKAVEYFVKEKLEKLGYSRQLEFVHFGLTSQDINNTAIPLSLKEAHMEVMMPALQEVIKRLNKQARDWKGIAMLARTHGQPASPTTLGKEILVFTERLEQQVKQWNAVAFSAKFGGATGNFNAHAIAYPKLNWPAFADQFVNKTLGLQRSRHTTQIEHYDNLAAYCDALKRINTILIDLSRDIWTYISMDYFKQKLKAGEVGSSAMPHKVNPIDFENAEGNLGMANALLEFFSAKLPVSRLQRDLTDSTVLRNLGVPMAHCLIAFQSLSKGLDKLILNREALNRDLEENWAVVAEAIQTILRREAYPKPYEALKALTRTNAQITKASLHRFIDSLSISAELKKELKAISPFTYTGVLPS